MTTTAPARTVFGPHGETEPLDLMDVEAHSGDPWPLYEWLREEAPVYQDANGIWFVSRYDDVVKVAMDPESFSSRDGNRPQLPGDESFMHRDGHEHLKRRGLVQKWFTPSAVAEMEGHVRTCVTELLDEICERGSCEYVSEVAARLPVRLICEMTGIPSEYWGEVREALDVFVQGGHGPEYVTEDVNEAFFRFGGLHYQLADERRDDPKDDFISLWLKARYDGRALTEDEVLWDHTNLIVGGSETTRNSITGGLWMLWKHPEQRQLLIDGEADFGNAAEEIIRWTTPFVSMSRTATRDVELGGHLVREGEEVVMLYPPANRDPRKFDRPQVFDITRPFPNRVLSFGIGRHVCLGAHLARLETKVVLQEMVTRFPDWEPDGELVWARSNFIRGLRRLPLRFTPGPRVGA